MSAKLVFDNITNELHIPKEMLPENGKQLEHHFLGTVQENLCELAGRVCYDSASKKNTRSSVDYFKHIKEVNHGSILEHCNLQINFTIAEKHYLEKGHILCNLVGRPGVYFTGCPTWTNCCTTWMMNLRSILEWHNWQSSGSWGDLLGYLIQQECKKFAPMVLGHIDIPSQLRNPLDINIYVSDLADSNNDDEIWASFYIYNVSRGLSHELVRHGDFTAISQRSTRYVDESESNWIWHPLLTKYKDQFEHRTWSTGDNFMEEAEAMCKNAYSSYVEELEELLGHDGIDKFTARKQARGAARGILGNALSTELIFSASLAQWKRMLKQRASSAADAEIRLLFNEIFLNLKDKFPDSFEQWTTMTSNDGIGFDVVETL